MPVNPFIGQIMPFGGNFAIRGWSECNGQILSINQYSALFSILGTTYGGDGVSTFALPDLRGRAIVGTGTGAGLSTYSLGQTGGTETVTLTSNQLPSHKHTYFASSAPNTSSSPINNALPTRTSRPIYATESPDLQMNSGVIGNTGGGQSHNNLQPYQVVNFLIAIQGLYPSRD